MVLRPLRPLFRAYRKTWRDILAYGERLADIMSAAGQMPPGR